MVSDALAEEAVDAIVITSKTDIMAKHAEWSENKTANILIVDQLAMRTLKIADVVHIIHFSFPCSYERFERNHRVSFDAHRQWLEMAGPCPTSTIVKIQEKVNINIFYIEGISLKLLYILESQKATEEIQWYMLQLADRWQRM